LTLSACEYYRRIVDLVLKSSALLGVSGLIFSASVASIARHKDSWLWIVAVPAVLVGLTLLTLAWRLFAAEILQLNKEEGASPPGRFAVAFFAPVLILATFSLLAVLVDQVLWPLFEGAEVGRRTESNAELCDDREIRE